MGDWAYWQKVVIIMLSVIVVILAYRKLLRVLGGKSLFDDKFAYLHALEREANLLNIKLELPVADSVSLYVCTAESVEKIRLVDQQQIPAGVHHYQLDTFNWEKEQYTIILVSGNQTIERIFKVE